MADEMEGMENLATEDDGQISEDDWATAMAEQAIAESPAAQPADIFPSFGGNTGNTGMMNELDIIADGCHRAP